MSRIAIVQHPPVLLDRAATLARAVELIDRAAGEGARLLVFPEAWVPGYPTWVWRLEPGGDRALCAEIHERLVENAVNLAAGQLAPLCAAARRNRVDVLVGCDELDHESSRTTLYNSYVHVDARGEIVNVHRKLMPTNPERMVWGLGDGRGLRVVDTPVGRVGSLICWESYMPLARMALYAQGVELYLAPTWDSSEGWLGSMQHVAREGRCHVVSCCSAMRAADVPADFPGRERCFPDEDEWINVGRSCAIAPGGVVVAGPLERESAILHVEIDRAAVRSARRTLDVAGHYNRPDVFELRLDRRPRGPLVLEDDVEEDARRIP